MRLRAELQIEVYTSSGSLKDKTQVPFRLYSSSSPGANIHLDSVAANAFSANTRKRSEANPLCEVQHNYTGTLGGGVWADDKTFKYFLNRI